MKQQETTPNTTMYKAGFDVIVGSFEKNGNILHATISAPKQKFFKTSVQEFKVLLSRPQSQTISFKIRQDDQGRWIPDQRRLVDPWIADKIGDIIQSKVIRK